MQDYKFLCAAVTICTPWLTSTHTHMSTSTHTQTNSILIKYYEKLRQPS